MTNLTSRRAVLQSQRACIARHVDCWDREETKQRLYEGRGEGNFRLICSGAWPACQTYFDAAFDENWLYVTVMTLESGNLGLILEGLRRAADSVEVFLDPFCDQTGYLQFGAGSDGSTFECSHWPYRDPERNACSDPTWSVVVEEEVQRPDLVRFYFFRCELARLRASDCIGFNVGRSQTATQENSTWNLISSIGFGDPGCFGRLWLAEPSVTIDAGSILLADDHVTKIHLTGTRSSRPDCRLSIRMIDPAGTVLFKSAAMPVRHGKTDTITVDVPTEVALSERGRYRLLLEATAENGKPVPCEPCETTVDWTPPAAHDRLQLQGTYDWPDNFGNVAYSPELLQKEMAWYKDCGLDRIYWLDYPVETWMGRAQHKPPHWNQEIKRSLELFGRQDFLKDAVAGAHRAGQEFVTIFKPFDLSLDDPFVQDHPELTLRCNPAWQNPAAPIATIQLAQRNDAPFPFDPRDLEVWESKDNRTYAPVSGQYQIREDVVDRPEAVSVPVNAARPETSADAPTRAVRRLIIEGLQTRAPFLALTWKNGDAGRSLRNRLYLLTETANAAGRAQPHLTAVGDAIPDEGFDFGPRQRNAPSWGRADTGQDRMIELKGDAGAIGMCRQLQDHLPGFLEPSFPEVQEFWLGRLRRGIDADADAISIRIAHHVGCVDWTAYMFAEPVLDEFRKRCGRDPEACNADLTVIRQIRGEAYTEFVRKTSQMAHNAGKRFQHHLENRMLVPPEYDSYCQIHWDWQTWIREGLVDEVDLKYIGPDHVNCYRDIVPLARQHGVKVNWITADPEPRSQPRSVDESPLFVDRAYNGGLDGINLYELWLYHRMTDRGTMMVRGSGEGIIRNMRNRIDKLAQNGGE